MVRVRWRSWQQWWAGGGGRGGGEVLPGCRGASAPDDQGRSRAALGPLSGRSRGLCAVKLWLCVLACTFHFNFPKIRNLIVKVRVFKNTLLQVCSCKRTQLLCARVHLFALFISFLMLLLFFPSLMWLSVVKKKKTRRRKKWRGGEKEQWPMMVIMSFWFAFFT